MKNVRAIAFKKALAEWDKFKETTAKMVAAGEITEAERLALMKAKAEELDL